MEPARQITCALLHLQVKAIEEADFPEHDLRISPSDLPVASSSSCSQQHESALPVPDGQPGADGTATNAAPASGGAAMPAAPAVIAVSDLKLGAHVS